MKKKAETILIVLGVFLTTLSLFDDHSDGARLVLALGTSFICLGFLLKQGFKKEKSSNLKKCPYCAEEIQDDAIKCRFCGEWFKKRGKNVLNEEPSKEKVSIENINVSSLSPNIPIVASINDNPKPDETKEIKTNSSSSDEIKIIKGELAWSTKRYVVYLIFLGLMFFSFTALYITSPTPLKGTFLGGFIFWCGVTSAVVAKRKGKSGTLWFFIGLIPIGLIIIFVLGFLRVILNHQ